MPAGGLMLHSTADLHTTKNCTSTQKANLKQFAMSSMDALQVIHGLSSQATPLTLSKHWFFWTWKIGPSAINNSPRSPLWSYKLGVDNGWIPKPT